MSNTKSEDKKTAPKSDKAETKKKAPKAEAATKAAASDKPAKKEGTSHKRAPLMPRTFFADSGKIARKLITFFASCFFAPW